MAPKKEEKKQVDPVEAKFQEEIKQLEQAKNDLQLEHTFLLDKFRQLKAENDRLRGEIDGMKGRLTHAADDYADILEHRQEQIKAEEAKLRGLQSNVEKLELDVGRAEEEIRQLKEANGHQGRESRFRVTGLKSNTEYIMCVKALYDDGSFLWSESKAYRTLA
ncbi:hypothetical protein CHLRE_08g383101v5 [Chlamydomonas reinhardtii]|uniref:Fibronectin type-III domain-containing protein n=1 Tax=Chlamydomonas reinhardtii TaxID=3055 RepID=A0A2K3DI75_CHLRE|nr:uncharacterized protein CHLRE_08g383101v5 [Chlamydomonas reinhardtii]PNW80231.1 hypothetical protein CHLRE_08g383101v5 [Chlamydomonas reinhardtii]